MIKHQQSNNVWVNDGTEFLGAFKAFCNKIGIFLYSTFRDKNSSSDEGNKQSLKNIIYR